MNLELIKPNNEYVPGSVKYLKLNSNGSYYSSAFYSEDMNYDFHRFTDLEKGMRILIPDCIKKKLLIRKINKYFKENHLDIKIVNDVHEANTICLSQELTPKVADNYLSIDDSDKSNIKYGMTYYANGHNSTPIKRVTFYYSATSKLMKLLNTNKIEDLLILFGNKFKYIPDTILFEITSNQYILDAADIEINSHKLKSMLVEEDSCRILCAALKNRDLTDYMKDIIDSYYLTNSGACRSMIKNKLLMRYREADSLVTFGDSWSNQLHKVNYYLSTMKKLNTEPDKEIVLEIVGFYK